jgi:hypothetical protein
VPADEAKRRRQEVAALIAIFGALAAIPVAGIIGLGIILSRLDFDLHLGREHLAPIPVPTQACPYLEPIRDQSNALSQLWMNGGLSGTVPFDKFRAELDLRLIALEADVRTAAPHVPAPIAERFRTIEWDVAVGRNYLPQSQNANELVFNDQFPLIPGWHALGEASDLVGTACGAALYSGVDF